MAGLISANILRPELASSFATGYQQAEEQRNRLATQAQQREVTQFNLDRAKEDYAAMKQLQQQLAAAGKDPDMGKVADALIASGNADYMLKGMDLKRRLRDVTAFEQMAGRMFPGLMPAGAPATPTAPAAPATPAAGASAMPVQQPASLTVTPLGEGGAPAPTNALRPQTAAPVAQANALQAQVAPGAGGISGMSTEQLRQAEIMFSQSGDPRAKALTGIIQKEIESRKQPDLVRGYLFAKTPEGGGFKGSLAEWKQLSAGQTKITLPPQEQAFEKGLGDIQAKKAGESQTAAEDAAAILRTNADARGLLDQGMITGAGAEFLVNLNQALKQVGVDLGYGDAAANAQAYAATLGNNVGKLIKQFGAGTGLSDADRKYAEQIAGGRISLDEKALRKILDINDRAARNAIAAHNKKYGGIKTNIPLTVEAPPEYKPPSKPSAPGSIAIPSEAEAHLRANPSLRREFDAKYGAGASDMILGAQ